MTVHPTNTTTHDEQCPSSAAAAPAQPPELAAANAPLIIIPRQHDGSNNGSSSNPCHFITKLPLELRNAIYALLLPPTPPQYPSSFRRYRMPASARPRFWTPAVAQTCRQLRREALTLYLGDHLLRVGLWAQEPWDALYLERWLQDLGPDARLVRRLAINHQVDFYHASAARSLACTQTVWADTVFTVVPGGEGEGEEEVVRVECDFGAPENPVSDQIPAGTVCLCPIAARMPPWRQASSSASGAASAASSMPVPPRTADCALTRAVYAFLALMDREGQDAFAVPRFAKGEDWGAKDGGGLCAGCGRRRWYLQGPKTAAYRRRLLGLGFDGAVVSEIEWNGWRWTVYHQRWAHKSMGQGQGQEGEGGGGCL
ncbi:hypothetical protein PG991_006779 [Apiospora marii]|uniref:F-box domain-containing protein n=1 Tax=Apiospora marii TaxID=335849 RepID=A0ABR1RYR5_9PEZI